MFPMTSSTIALPKAVLSAATSSVRGGFLAVFLGDRLSDEILQQFLAQRLPGRLPRDANHRLLRQRLPQRQLPPLAPQRCPKWLLEPDLVRQGRAQ